MKISDIKRMAHEILENNEIESDHVEYKKSIQFQGKILKTACRRPCSWSCCRSLLRRPATADASSSSQRIRPSCCRWKVRESMIWMLLRWRSGTGGNWRTRGFITISLHGIKNCLRKTGRGDSSNSLCGPAIVALL